MTVLCDHSLLHINTACPFCFLFVFVFLWWLAVVILHQQRGVGWVAFFFCLAHFLSRFWGCNCGKTFFHSSYCPELNFSPLPTHPAPPKPDISHQFVGTGSPHSALWHLMTCVYLVAISPPPFCSEIYCEKKEEQKDPHSRFSPSFALTGLSAQTLFFSFPHPPTLTFPLLFIFPTLISFPAASLYSPAASSSSSILLCCTQVVSQRFPQNSIGAVGSAMFLRFVNPAIVSPYEAGILDKKPLPRIERGLKLMSKVIGWNKVMLYMKWSLYKVWQNEVFNILLQLFFQWPSPWLLFYSCVFLFTYLMYTHKHENSVTHCHLYLMYIIIGCQ